MNLFIKYIVPGVALTSLVMVMCNTPAEKEIRTGKAGDQLDLFAVMNTFKTSASPEAFEKLLNTKSKGVNNLDLNEDGQTDYIKVTDKKIDDKSHLLILQVDVASGKTQDVATIEIQKTGEKTASLQIIGDDDLYGSDYIVEPESKDASAAFVVATTFAVNVWTWPAIAFIYSPAYVVWVSPYYYEYYPVWWEPWPVVEYDVYYPIVSVYHSGYAFSDGYRFVNVHENYHNNYRVHTNFNYHEKNYGTSGAKVNGNRNDGTKEKDNNAFGKNSGSGDHNKSTGADKKSSPFGGNKSGDKDNNKSSGNKQQQGGGHDAIGNTPSSHGGMSKSQPAKSTSPKHSNSPKQYSAPKGGKSGGNGGHGSGGKHK